MKVVFFWGWLVTYSRSVWELLRDHVTFCFVNIYVPISYLPTYIFKNLDCSFLLRGSQTCLKAPTPPLTFDSGVTLQKKIYIKNSQVSLIRSIVTMQKKYLTESQTGRGRVSIHPYNKKIHISEDSQILIVQIQ